MDKKVERKEIRTTMYNETDWICHRMQVEKYIDEGWKLISNDYINGSTRLAVLERKVIENKDIKDTKDIYYMVKIKENYNENFHNTVIKNKFCGKIVNQAAGNIYFELYKSDALVIMPHNWIEWLAPSKTL